jgi:rare lipoprotein A
MRCCVVSGLFLAALAVGAADRAAASSATEHTGLPAFNGNSFIGSYDRSTSPQQRKRLARATYGGSEEEEDGYEAKRTYKSQTTVAKPRSGKRKASHARKTKHAGKGKHAHGAKKAARGHARSRRVAARHRGERSGGPLAALLGLASFYWQPQRVASGGWFNPNAMTAAHKTLPFGTRVRVTHLGNGRSVDVRINDRGPYVRGRIIDLSKAAAGAIGLHRQGVARVRVTVLGR